MRRDEVLAILAEHRDEIRALGVTSVSLFGSVARDEAVPGSDIDLLIEVERPFGLFALARVQIYLEELLGCPVDLVHRDSIKPMLRERILGEAIHAAQKRGRSSSSRSLTRSTESTSTH